MPIHFLCPACASKLSVAERKGGSEVRCPKCAQRIVVPTPADEALPGVLIEYGPPPEPVLSLDDAPAPPTLVAPPANTRAFDFEDDPEPAIIRRRRRSRSPLVNVIAVLYAITGVLSIVCGGLLFVGAGVAVTAIQEANVGDRVLVGGAVSGVAFVIVLFGIPDLLAAYGVWQRTQWGYVLALVLAGINALWAFASIFWMDVCSVFICGSLAIYTLVVLFNPRYSKEFS